MTQTPFTETEALLHYVRGFNPPVVILCDHPTYTDCVYVAPAALPWASGRLVRRDQLAIGLRKA